MSIHELVALTGSPSPETSIDWMYGYANSPSMSIGIEHTGVIDRLREEPYEVLHAYSSHGDIGQLVLARTNGVATFYATCAVENGGYGGRTFHIPIMTGDPEFPVIELECGAWSSNADAMNRYIHDPNQHIMEVGSGNYALEIPLMQAAVQLWNEKYSQGMGGEAVLIAKVRNEGNLEWGIRWVEYSSPDYGHMMLKPKWKSNHEMVYRNKWDSWDAPDKGILSFERVMSDYADYTGDADMEDNYDA